MARITPVTPEKAEGEIKDIYADIKKNLGKVPNIFQYMGNSATMLQSFFNINEVLNHSSLSPKLRSLIALAVAQANECNYCLSAHTTIAGGQGLQSNEIINARKGESQDAKTRAILHFTKLVVEKRGKVSDQDVKALKAAGVDDRALVEIILTINLNMLTNYFNHIVDTPIDFAAAPELTASIN
jgi:uncharacterized peroxidase-related enzyme